MLVVVNAAPLIGLAAIGQLDLLRRLYGEVNLAEAVYREVVVQGAERYGTQEVSRADWLSRHPVDAQEVADIMRAAQIHEGETASLVLAQKLKAAWLVIDDLKARNYAQLQG